MDKKGLDTEGYVVLQPNWQAVAAAPLCDGDWHHVAVTYEKASQTFSLFVDYRLVGSKAGVAIEASSNQFPLQGMVVAAVAALSLAAWAFKPPVDTQDGETRTLTFGVRAKPGRVLDAQLMAEMAEGTSRAADAAKYRARADAAHAYLKQAFFATEDGTILPVFKGMQTPALFALQLGLVEGAAKAKTVADLKASIAAGGGTLHTGVLGTSIALDALTASGLSRLAYDLLLNHRFPGWLYSVDQGATTVWERWNSYTKKDGFGPVGMNSFNHYAYGAVLAWMYKTMAGIAADPKAPGFRNVVMAPVPDRRLGFVKAAYRSAAGLIRSEWRYAGDTWVWTFTVPTGATADVTLPGAAAPTRYGAGTHVIRRKL